MKQYNEKLVTWLENKPNKDAGIDNIQKPGEVEHVVWQTRPHVPSAYEADLVQSLITVFEQGHEELDDVVNALNQEGVRLETGESWTTESFQQEMARLGF